MTLDPADLHALLLDLAGLSPAEIERLGRETYAAHYLLEGRPRRLPTHDGQDVIFYPDRFEHAFFTSSDRASHPERKDRIALERIERILWIKEVIAGNVAGSACWEVSEQRGGRGERREYAILSECYVVWLVARGDGGYRFETAYPAMHQDLSRYARQGRRIWRSKIEKPRD